MLLLQTLKYKSASVGNCTVGSFFSLGPALLSRHWQPVCHTGSVLDTGVPKGGLGDRHTLLVNSWYMINVEGHMEGIPAYCKIKIKLKNDLHTFTSFTMLKNYALPLQIPSQLDVKCWPPPPNPMNSRRINDTFNYHLSMWVCEGVCLCVCMR